MIDRLFPVSNALMVRWLAAVCMMGFVVDAAAQGGRGGNPGSAIGAPPAIVIPPPAPPTKVGAGAISGIVTDASTGAPLEGALVRLSGGGAPGQPVNRPPQMTDSRGRFIFPHLPASTTYSLYASRPGYGNGRSELRLAEGEWLRDRNIKLPLLAAISGTIRDERGEPFVGVPIQILIGATVAGRLRWASGPVTETDDRGMYRFGALSKGRYLVHVPGIQITLPTGEVALYRPPSGASAAGAAAPGQTRAVLHVVRGPDGSGVVAGLFPAAPPDNKGSVYASVFHPGARSVDQAEPIALEFGADRTGVDIQMTPVASVSVSGRVAGPADAVAGVPVRILPAGNELIGQAGDAGLTSADAAGRFTFQRIPAGDYVIIASRSVADYQVNAARQPLLPVGANPFSLTQGFMPASNGMLLNSSRMRGADITGRLQVSVGDRALSGLVVPVGPTVSVSGHVEWDGSETPSAALSQALVLLDLEPADGDVALGQYQGEVSTNAATRTFTFDNVKPGRYLFGNILSPVSTLRLVGATWNGRDIIGTPLEVSGDGPVTGIVVRLSTQINKVTGTVRGADGRAATEGAVIAFPTSPAAWRDSGLSAILFRTANIAADGSYELPPMLPGEYFLAAISTENQGRALEPDFLDSISRQATRVSLGLASTLSQDLRFVNMSGQ
jgi:hypothetical protein